KDGDRKKASLQHPLGLYADVTGVYIADAYNHSIRRYDPKKQELETVVGDGDRGSNANDKAVDADDVEMNEPSAITQLADGRFVIADTNNHRLLFWNKDKEKVERMKIEGEKSSSPVSVPDIDADGKKKLSTRLPNVLESRDEKVNRTNPEVRIVL